MAATIDDNVADTRPPSSEEQFWAEFGREIVRRQVPFLNDTLFRLTTLCGAMVGAIVAIVRLTESGAVLWPWKMAVVLLLGGLFVSLWGLLPFTKKFNPSYPMNHRRAYLDSAKWKTDCARVAGVLMFLGIVVFALIVMFR